MKRYLLLLKYFITFFGCIMKVGGTFWWHLQAPYVSNRIISVKIDSQIAYKMLDLGYPLRMGNGMLCYEQRHTLLLKSFISPLRGIKGGWGLSDSINKTSPLLLSTPCHFCQGDSQIVPNMSDVGGYPVSTGYKMLLLRWNERQPLLLKCLITFNYMYIEDGISFSQHVWSP